MITCATLRTPSMLLLLCQATLVLQVLRCAAMPADARYTRKLQAGDASIGRRGGIPPPAPGLPASCLNYSQRYKHEYYRGLQHSNVANARNKHSEFLVVLMLHNMRKDGHVALDAILNIRALAQEVTHAGYHFLILFQVPNPTFYQSVNPDDVPRNFTHEQVLELLPLDLRPFVVVHDFELEFESYPKLGAPDNPNLHPAHGWGVGPRASYVSMTRLMQQYKGYKWAWSIESDVRWTGADWGHLLNAALNLGIRTTSMELAADPMRLVKMDRVASRELPRSLEGVPDLLTFSPIFVSEKWRKLDHNMGNATELYDAMATIYGGSRKLYDMAHDFCLRGIGSHLEVFLPTLAAANGLKAGGLAVERHPALPASWHCCLQQGALAYSDFHNRSACSTGLMLHPVKNKEPFWPKVSVV